MPRLYSVLLKVLLAGGLVFLFFSINVETTDAPSYKDTQSLKEYGHQSGVLKVVNGKYNTVCLDGVEYWYNTRKMAVRFSVDSKVVKCNSEKLENFKKQVKEDKK